MAKPIAWGTLLLATALGTRAADAQTPPATPAPESVDIAAPGAALLDEVLVQGNGERNVERATSEVVSLLTAEDMARSGDGDIAGALSRVPGLSLVGGGFVYVRGLGDRYSLALLNGSPLPSPEPMRRAVPLDLFPTDIVASSLVQKTYSANYPGEFGGGVINLTTLGIPKTSFLTLGGSVGGDTETTNQTGYDYYGSKSDWTGYDNGNRDTPAGLRDFISSRQRMSAGSVDSSAIAGQFVNWSNALVQKIEVPVNYSGSLSAGDSWSIGDSTLGVIATAGYNNKWRVRDNTEQTPASADLSVIDKDYRVVTTDDRVVANGLLGFTYEFGDSWLRWTNLYVHDTLKRTSLGGGQQNSQKPGTDFLDQGTSWYERELLTTQLAGSIELDPVTMGLRGSYSRARRDAPYELNVGYSRSNVAESLFGAYYINRLDNGQTGHATVSFSNLDEDLWSGGLDFTWRVNPKLALVAGYDFTETSRDSLRREFQMVAPSTLPSEVAMLRADLLLAPDVIEFYDIGLIETTESDPEFAATLRTHAPYAQLQLQLTDDLQLSAGARYEKSRQYVRPVQVFDVATNSGASTNIEKDYLLPSATLTWRFQDDMQLRFNASKTLARPQFRELMFQAYYDPENNRHYLGNPMLGDSTFVNAEARYEWYYAPEQQVSFAGFYKKLDRPIEAYTGFNDNTPVTSFANAPRATLYGGEAEFQKYFTLDSLARRIVTIANYTYTNSSIGVGANDTTQVYGSTVTTRPASDYFVDGTPLTGQSDHIVNLQLGLEAPGRLSQQTILLSYASDRVTSRGAGGLPDIYESPGLRVDFVARQGMKLFDQDLELKLELRNLFQQGYSEFQQRDGNTVYYNRYDVGVSYALSMNMTF